MYFETKFVIPCNKLPFEIMIIIELFYLNLLKLKSKSGNI
jgi:hypothetical protein